MCAESASGFVFSPVFSLSTGLTHPAAYLPSPRGCPKRHPKLDMSQTRRVICFSSPCPQTCVLLSNGSPPFSPPCPGPKPTYFLLDSRFSFIPHPIHHQALPALPSKYIWNLTICTTSSANNLLPATRVSHLEYYGSFLTVPVSVPALCL